MLKYQNQIVSNHIVYSCDMLRLKFRIPKYLSDTFLNSLHNTRFCFKHNIDYDCWFSPAIGKYRNLIRYKADDYTFTIGFPFNTYDRTESSYTGYIEFNPNKCDLFVVQYFLDIIYLNARILNYKVFDIVGFDLAVDIPAQRSNVVLVKKGKREHTRITGASVTEYLGNRGAHGSVKVYDKQAEARLDFPLTRIEITLKDITKVELPEVYVFDDFDSDAEFEGLNDTDKVIVSLIRQLPYEEQQQYFRQLGRGKREKLAPYIYPSDNKFKFDKQAIMWTVAYYQQYEFNFRDSFVNGHFEYYFDLKEINEECERRRDAAAVPFADYFIAPSYERG